MLSSTLQTSYVTTAESSEKPVTIVKSSKVITPLSRTSQSMPADPKNTILGEDADTPWTTDYVQSQVTISGIDIEGLSELSTKADRSQQPSVKEATNISAGVPSTVIGESLSYNTHHGNSQNIPLTAVGSSQTLTSVGGERHTTAPNAALLSFQTHDHIGLSIYATQKTRLDGIMRTYAEETQSDIILFNLESQTFFEGGAPGLPDAIDTSAAHVLINIFPSSEEPSVLPLESLAFGPRPDSAIPDTGESSGIISHFFSELGQMTSEDSHNTISVNNLFMSGKHATDSPEPESLSHSMVGTYKKAAIGPATAITSSPNRQPYYTANTPRTSSVSHSKVTSMSGTVPLLRAGEAALTPLSGFNYRLSDFQHLTTRPQWISISLHNTIRTIESSTAIPFRGSSGQKIEPATKTDVFQKSTQKFHILESESVSSTTGLILAKDSQALSSTWTIGPSGQSMGNIGKSDATNLENPLPSTLSENSGRTTNVASETSAETPSSDRLITSDALHDAAGSHTANKKSALASIGAILGAVCLFVVIFEWARRRRVGRSTTQIGQLKARELRWQNPNRSYFSLDSSTQL